jgi:hypothetical protein
MCAKWFHGPGGSYCVWESPVEKGLFFIAKRNEGAFKNSHNLAELEKIAYTLAKGSGSDDTVVVEGSVNVDRKPVYLR